MNHLTRLAAIVSAVALLSACGQGTGSPVGAPSSTDTPTASPSTAAGTPSEVQTDEPSESPSAPFHANTARDTEDSSGYPVVVTDVELSTHEGFDRITLTTSDEGAAGWSVEYADRAIQDGSGKEVDVSGEVTLATVLTGIAYPDDSDATPYDGARTIDGSGTTTFREVVVGTTFEGQMQLWVGMDEELPFRVVRGDAPHTIVIEILHPDVAS